MCFGSGEAFEEYREVVEGIAKKRFPRKNGESSNEPLRRAMTRVRVGTGLSDKFSVKVGVHQGSVLSPLLFAVVVDVVTENAREGLLNEILYADDLVLVSESMEDLRTKFEKWRKAFESKGMKVNLGKTKLMVSRTEENYHGIRSIHVGYVARECRPIQ